MGIGRFIHYLGSALLFIAMVLTIVVDISAPVVDSISFVELDLPGGADARFGVFGYCSKSRASADWVCTDASIGYDPASVIERVSAVNYSNARSDTIEALTRVLVLHPIGTAALFVAFLLSLAAGSTVISILAMLVSLVAFIINAIAVVIDFVTFTLLGNEINDLRGADAAYGTAAWLALAAAVLALIATIIMFITCCAGRRSKKRDSRRKTMEGGYGNNGGTTY
jgi:uncharacterized membrane protein